jgi:hypothetical protein
MEREDVVELVEARLYRANLYLEHGYKLLSVLSTSEEDRGRLTGNAFVRRGIKYVLGRTADVAHYDAPNWQPKQAQAMADGVEPPEPPPAEPDTLTRE